MAYVIIETEDGMTVVPLEPDASPESAAAQHGGFLVDPESYPSYAQACDALNWLETEDEGDSSR